MHDPLIHPYMSSDVVLERLLGVHRTHGALTVAVDFDNTLFDFHYERERRLRDEHDYGEVYDLLRRLKAVGCHIVVWTANQDEGFIARFLREREVPFDAINENPPYLKSTARKIFYNVLLDDAAGLRETYLTLRRFLEIVTNPSNRTRSQT